MKLNKAILYAGVACSALLAVVGMAAKAYAADEFRENASLLDFSKFHDPLHNLSFDAIMIVIYSILRLCQKDIS